MTEWVNDILDNWKSSTALNRCRSLFRFFEFLVEAGEIKASPMARMKPPNVEEEEVPAISDADLQKLLKACDGKESPSARAARQTLAKGDRPPPVRAGQAPEG